MKKLYLIISLLFILINSYSQNNNQADVILDKTIAELNKSGCIELTFSGSQKGTLLLKGNKFFFNSGNTKSWFDGITQWSLVISSNEVNISNPTKEELQYVNPYYLLQTYKSNYNHKFLGEIKHLGKKCYNIILTPKKKSSIASVNVYIDKSYKPSGMKVTSTNRSTETLNITSYKTNMRINDSTFRFNKNKYPKVEIIDLR